MDSIGNRLSELDFTDQCVAEARRLYRDRLLAGLRQHVKIQCKATFIADAMVVQLLDNDGKELHRHVIRNINGRIYAGSDSDREAGDIVKDFKRNLLKKYFKHSYCRQ